MRESYHPRESKGFEKRDVMVLQLGIILMNRSRVDTNNQNCYSTRFLETQKFSCDSLCQISEIISIQQLGSSFYKKLTIMELN